MLKWIGRSKGIECLPGYPARDLHPDEIARYGGEKFLIDTGLWSKPAPEPKKKEEKPVHDDE